jgi:hypothetical protein
MNLGFGRFFAKFSDFCKFFGFFNGLLVGGFCGFFFNFLCVFDSF